MTTIVSNAPTYKAALVAAVQADSVLVSSQTQILYGASPRTIEHESIEFGNIEYSPVEDWAALGARRKDETFSITVYVLVTTEGLTQQEATERVYVLLGRVETVMRSNIQLNGVHWSALVPDEVAEQPSDTGYMAMAKAQVVVFARK